jgi:hypothetical protein
MASLSNPKLFAAFLNGIHQRLFEKNAEMTNQFLKEQIFPDQVRRRFTLEHTINEALSSL